MPWFCSRSERRAGSAGATWTVGRFTVSTDDAYVQAYNTTLAAKVAGYVASVPVTDNMQVHAGDVIATIDDGDYRLAVTSARDKVATQEATIARMGHQITRRRPRSSRPGPNSSPRRPRRPAPNWS